MFVGSIRSAIESDETTKNILDPIIPELKEWETKLELSGIMTLALVITAFLPINPFFRLFAGVIEFSGGAITWLFV